MKHFLVAIGASLALLASVLTASAAQAPASTPKAAIIAGMTGAQLPATSKQQTTENIQVAQRRGRRGVRRGRVRRGGIRRGRRGFRRGRGRRRGRRIGRGLAIGGAILGAAIIASQAARAEGSYGRRCRRWRRLCRRGRDWACYRYDDRC